MIEVRFYHPVTGQRRSVTVPTEGDAAMVRNRIEDLKLGLRLGTLTADRAMYELRRLSPSRRGRRTLREAALAWAEHVSPRTQRETLSHLNRGPLASIAEVPLESLDIKQMSSWIVLLRGSYADGSIVGAWRVVSAIVRSAITRRWIDVLPWGDWRPRGLDPTPRARDCATTPLEIARLLAAARELDDNSMQRIATFEIRMALALMLGLRSGELCGLRWSDLDLERRRVTIARQYCERAPKTTPATLAASPELFAILAKHRERLEPYGLYTEDGPLFPHLPSSRPGRPKHCPTAVLSGADVRRVVRLAGLPNAEKWTVHSLRASFVCVELAASGSVAHAMQRARHRSIKATQHYIRGLLELSPAEPAWSLPPVPPKPAELES
jgi:integrase